MNRASSISLRTGSRRSLARMAWVALALCGFMGGVFLPTHDAATRAAESTVVDDDGDMARKADIMHGAQWQRAVAELGCLAFHAKPLFAERSPADQDAVQ